MRLGVVARFGVAEGVRLGKRADLSRNQRMVDAGADICLGVPSVNREQQSTRDSALPRAIAAGIPTYWSTATRAGRSSCSPTTRGSRETSGPFCPWGDRSAGVRKGRPHPGASSPHGGPTDEARAKNPVADQHPTEAPSPPVDLAGEGPLALGRLARPDVAVEVGPEAEPPRPWTSGEDLLTHPRVSS